MNLGDFAIGADFELRGEKYRCIDIGTKSIVANRVVEINSQCGVLGQFVIDEYYMQECTSLVLNTTTSRVYKNIPQMKLSPHWDLSQERLFIENLLNQRFNFMMVFFSLVVAGAINARTVPFVSAGIAALGYWICRLLAKTVGRAQEKLDKILTELSTDYMHPVAFTDREATSTESQRHLIGKNIPELACKSLIAVSVVFIIVSLYQLLNDEVLKLTKEQIIQFLNHYKGT